MCYKNRQAFNLIQIEIKINFDRKFQVFRTTNWMVS